MLQSAALYTLFLRFTGNIDLCAMTPLLWWGAIHLASFIFNLEQPDFLSCHPVWAIFTAGVGGCRQKKQNGALS